jgi:protein SCO1/2
MKKLLIIFVILSFVALTGRVYGHQENDAAPPGVIEKTGQVLPGDIVFSDAAGKKVSLNSLINKPTILSFVYYNCVDICQQMLGGLAISLSSIRLTPGKDYKLVTVSFDEEDTPMIANRQKVNYVKASGMALRQEDWQFLTGDRENIRRITEATGFNFRKEVLTGSVGFGTRKESLGFIHPSVLIFLAPDRKITRYLYVEQSHYGTLAPIAFSPVDIATSLAQASQGKIWVGTKNPLRLCFPGLTENEARFYTLLSSVGVVTLICLLGFIIYLRRPSKKTIPDNSDARGQ